MQTKAALYFPIGFFLIAIAEIVSHTYAASTPTKGESLDELHEKTKKEGGKLNLYASLSGNSIDVILPAFQKRFPGVTVDHTDATGDKLIARIVEPLEKVRPAAAYMLGQDDVKEFPKYEKLWKEILIVVQWFGT